MTPSRHLLAALALVCLALPSRAEPAPVAVALADTGRLTLPTDPKAKRKLQAVEDYVQSEDWQAVARSIQELLDLPQDVFAQRQRARVVANRALCKRRPSWPTCSAEMCTGGRVVNGSRL